MAEDTEPQFLGRRSTGKIRCPGCVTEVLHLHDREDKYVCYGCGYSIPTSKPVRHETKMTLAEDVEDPDAVIITEPLHYENERPRRRIKPGSKVDLHKDKSVVAFEDIELEASSSGITVVDVQDTSHHYQSS